MEKQGANEGMVAANATPERPAARALRLAGALVRSRRRVATAAAIVLALLLGYHVIFGQNGVTVYRQKRVEDRQLQQEIDALRSENERLKGHVEHLQTDSDAIEHEARERLHYARPGEVIYTLNDKPPAASPGETKPAGAKPAPPQSATK